MSHVCEGIELNPHSKLVIDSNASDVSWPEHSLAAAVNPHEWMTRGVCQIEAVIRYPFQKREGVREVVSQMTGDDWQRYFEFENGQWAIPIAAPFSDTDGTGEQLSKAIVAAAEWYLRLSAIAPPDAVTWGVSNMSFSLDYDEYVNQVSGKLSDRLKLRKGDFVYSGRRNEEGKLVIGEVVNNVRTTPRVHWINAPGATYGAGLGAYVKLSPQDPKVIAAKKGDS